MLRLGRGARDVKSKSNSDFSKFGRVNFLLTRRLEELQQVRKLALSLGFSQDDAAQASSSCKEALQFATHTLTREWEKFKVESQQPNTKANKSPASAEPSEQQAIERLIAAFPFARYFCDLHSVNSLFDSCTSAAQVRSRADAMWEDLQSHFRFIESCLAFELLRSYSARSEYILNHHARLVACTSTFLSLNADLGRHVKFDSILFEEASQQLESLVVVAMSISAPSSSIANSNSHSHRGGPKRVVMIGDEHQLSPVLSLRALSAASFDQSLFVRLIRQGVPNITLNAQGRCRASIGELWKPYYTSVEVHDLPRVQSAPDFSLGVSGLAHELQFVDCQFNGIAARESRVGTSFQNLGEAEFCVLLFLYLRLVGWPASQIAIITSYSAQKQLIQDILRKRCLHLGAAAAAGSNSGPSWQRRSGGDVASSALPAFVETVDRAQGQQCSIVLLSLVRTEEVGHMRDRRRIVVALSRARLGLYVVGCRRLFANCIEMAPAMQVFAQRPHKLQLLPAERVDRNQSGSANNSHTEPKLAIVGTKRCATDAKSESRDETKSSKQIVEVQDAAQLHSIVEKMIQNSAINKQS